MTTEIALRTTAREITELFNSAASHVGMAFDDYIKIGEKLTVAKASLPHGQWIPWVEKNLPFNDRQAWKYMRIYDNKETLNLHPSGDLALNDAVNLLSTPKKEIIPDEYREEPEEEFIDAESEPVETEEEGDPRDVPEIRATNTQQDVEAAGRRMGSLMQAVKRLTVSFEDVLLESKRFRGDNRDHINSYYETHSVSELTKAIRKLETKLF